ncbi:uncharacterized protein RJT21DRAFT_89416 [Scheffersomyces amazonensis]|uniref:uncharacterized protein n=1 Tax=Scheffersomyces amazonensis TaxID=1078765 RepID=UPI00315CED36
MPSSPVPEEENPDQDLLPPSAIKPTNDSSSSLYNSNINNLSSNNSGTSSPIQPPANIRRPSFGLNLLNSLTSSIRSSNSQSSQINPQPTQSPPSPLEASNIFMSNSPTIANLSNYASTTLYDEAMANAHRQHNHVNPRLSRHRPSRQNTLDANNPGAENNSSSSASTSKEKLNGMDKDGFFSVRLTPLIDHSSSASGLYFSPIIRKIKPESDISIGRYTEKNKAAAHAPQGSSAPIVFKSKVVSRTHALFHCNEDGQWFLKDCKSSSGTFLNHIRLSAASQESTLMPLIDGDIIQLGMDYRGGTEEVYRCVKMRCEFNKSWQRKVNQFNLEIHKKLKNLQIRDDDNTNTECAICLMKIEPCQALFISPCSHAWHYKCIRPIIIKSYPQFYCPNCRTMCDLETDLDDDD